MPRMGFVEFALSLAFGNFRLTTVCTHTVQSPVPSHSYQFQLGECQLHAIWTNKIGEFFPLFSFCCYECKCNSSVKMKWVAVGVLCHHRLQYSSSTTLNVSRVHIHTHWWWWRKSIELMTSTVNSQVLEHGRTVCVSNKCCHSTWLNAFDVACSTWVWVFCKLLQEFLREIFKSFLSGLTVSSANCGLCANACSLFGRCLSSHFCIFLLNFREWKAILLTIE